MKNKNIQKSQIEDWFSIYRKEFRKTFNNLNQEEKSWIEQYSPPSQLF